MLMMTGESTYHRSPALHLSSPCPSKALPNAHDCQARFHREAFYKCDRWFCGAQSLPESGSSSDQSHKIYFTDVLTFEHLNDAQILDMLTHLERYSGIWVTSPRITIAVSNAVNKLELELKQQVFKKLQSMPVFSVGAATSRDLLPLGVICKGDDAGSADMLSEYLHHNGGLPADCKEKPMMFLCGDSGDKRRDVIPDRFRSKDLPLEELVVYQTCALQNIAIPDECRVPDWVVFFSPSGLEPAKHLPLPWEPIRKAAIGRHSTLCNLIAKQNNVTLAPVPMTRQDNCHCCSSRARCGYIETILGSRCDGT
ncbi:hypothetical protein PsorP6_014391 [Peronosclerospora sorghi]|uniref:Uncharacterized protein n=1 Tax=Peronosclerospora sorghi TaxID=230839 RepID=A0ACC0VGS1_9STRA|nr:hypothetical protein PsorP6_014391 [Peronosclerospora sorghi]